MSTPDLDDPKTLAAAWICFERCFGTLEQLKSCQALCQSVLFDYHRTQQKLLFNKPKTPFNKKTDKTTSPAEKKDKKPVKRKPENGDDAVVSKTAKERKKPKTETTEQLLKETEQLKLDLEAKAKDKLARDAVTVFFSNLSFDVTEEDITVGFPDLTIKSIDLAKSASGKSRGFAYVEVDSEVSMSGSMFCARLKNFFAGWR
jgi:squamous cell carcinoma antigen recognized by T-cells 3